MKKTDITVDQFNSAEIINMNDRKIRSLHNNASKQLTILYFLKSSVTSESRLSCKVLFVFCILELVFFCYFGVSFGTFSGESAVAKTLLLASLD